MSLFPLRPFFFPLSTPGFGWLSALSLGPSDPSLHPPSLRGARRSKSDQTTTHISPSRAKHAPRHRPSTHPRIPLPVTPPISSFTTFAAAAATERGTGFLTNGPHAVSAVSLKGLAKPAVEAAAAEVLADGHPAASEGADVLFFGVLDVELVAWWLDGGCHRV